MYRRYKSRWWAFFVCIFLWLSNSNWGYAQIGIGGGFEYGTGAFINDGFFIKRPSLGITGMLSYAPRESKLFPSFTYLLKTMVVPVNNSYFANLSDLAKTQHFVLNLNYRTSPESNYYQFFMGVGASKITPETDLSDNNGYAVKLIDTAAANLYPIVQLGAKYMHRILENSSFYLGLEANLKYIRMHSDNVYYLQQDKNLVKASIGGDVIFPSVQIHLDYFFDGNERRY